MICASDAPTSDSLKSVGNAKDDSDKRAPSELGCVVLSCKAFLLLSALFLLQVVSISKSNGAKFHAKELPRIQEALNRATVNQVKERKKNSNYLFIKSIKE